MVGRSLTKHPTVRKTTTTSTMWFGSSVGSLGSADRDHLKPNYLPWWHGTRDRQDQLESHRSSPRSTTLTFEFACQLARLTAI